MKTSIALFGLLCLAAPLFAADTTASAPAGEKRFKIIQTAHPLYPTRMLHEGISTGSVRVVLQVNASGQLVDHLFVAYTRRAFADEVLRVVKKWKFEPAYSNGEPVDTVVDLAFNFEVNGVLLVERFGCDLPVFDAFREYEYTACNLKNLDQIPTPVNIVNPTYPKDWVDKGIVGKVAIDFYIDETGKVRFAAAPAGSNEMLAGIAVAAVNKWQFAPPTRKGRPVLVHAQQVFDFH
ncbi:MAG: TonB family protein [Nibricoccus sp.]